METLNENRLDFVKAEIRFAITQIAIARSTSDFTIRMRSRLHAREAYETVRHIAACLSLPYDDAAALAEESERIRTAVCELERAA